MGERFCWYGKTFFLFGLCFISLVSAQSRVISFYHVGYLPDHPQIDGKLTENCWQQCQKEGEFYKYWQTKPVKGELKTEFMMFYNERGLYFASINYDDYLEKIRATRTMRDDPELWTDDCNEIYFDPEGKGVGYLAFVVNFLGTKTDIRRIDTANTDISWNLENWEYKTSKTKDFWVVESFFPWTDVFKKPREGSLWMFDLVRYSFSTGKFRGVSWSCGGSNATPDKFGYLYFSSKKLNLEDIGRLLSREITPPWELPWQDGFVLCETKGKCKFVRANDVLEEEKSKIQVLLSEVESRVKNLKAENVGKKLEGLKEEFQKLASVTPTLEGIKEVKELKGKVEDLYWELRIEEVLK